jgi:chemotaxis response regulator CheB
MPVELITDRRNIQSNHVFIIPANCELHILDNEFRLKPLSKDWGWPDVITIFLHSLTQNWDGELIAIIVSGLSNDGTEALYGIKEVGVLPLRRSLKPPNSQICRIVQ